MKQIKTFGIFINESSGISPSNPSMISFYDSDLRENGEDHLRAVIPDITVDQERSQHHDRFELVLRSNKVDLKNEPYLSLISLCLNTEANRRKQPLRPIPKPELKPSPSQLNKSYDETIADLASRMGESAQPSGNVMASIYDKYTKEGAQEEFDHFNKLVVPKMKAAGFKRVIEPVPAGSPSYGSGYFCFPDHSTGVNLFLSTSYTKPWKYVVFQNGNKDLKEFQWKVGTDSEVSKCANDAVAYAISLKEKMK